MVVCGSVIVVCVCDLFLFNSYEWACPSHWEHCSSDYGDCSRPCLFTPTIHTHHSHLRALPLQLRVGMSQRCASDSGDCSHPCLITPTIHTHHSQLRAPLLVLSSCVCLCRRVVCCVVLFLLCVCVCDLFLFLHPLCTPTTASPCPSIHVTCFSSYSYEWACPSHWEHCSSNYGDCSHRVYSHPPFTPTIHTHHSQRRALIHSQLRVGLPQPLGALLVRLFTPVSIHTHHSQLLFLFHSQLRVGLPQPLGALLVRLRRLSGQPMLLHPQLSLQAKATRIQPGSGTLPPAGTLLL